MKYDYDVIIVGGRVAGSNLASRLGQYGMRVLILERNALPSLPAVSSPIIYASTMQLLDEIGAQESEYALNTPRIHHMATVNKAFTGKLRIPDYQGRDYAYALDRARFDHAIWETALRQPTVEGRMNTSVTDLLRDEVGAVCGVVVKSKEGVSETITARAVVGADGRFSVVARKAEAHETERHDDNPTSIYYAYWRNVAPLDEAGASAAAYEADGTFGYLVMDSADGQTVVCMEGRSDVLDATSGNTLEDFYLDKLHRNEKLWSRLENAERVTTIRGMRHIGNLYRQAGGEGWALVGDAFHQKDPLDGQGIYDAIYMGKILAHAMKKWWDGTVTWVDAIAAYEQIVHTKTYPMFKTLQGRVKNSFYNSIALPIPDWAVGKIGQWVTEDGQMSALFGKVLTRQIPPDMMTLFTAPVIVGAIARGGLKEMRSEVEKRVREVMPFLNR